jgi:hypothetical protein
MFGGLRWLVSDHPPCHQLERLFGTKLPKTEMDMYSFCIASWVSGRNNCGLSELQIGQDGRYGVNFTKQGLFNTLCVPKVWCPEAPSALHWHSRHVKRSRRFDNSNHKVDVKASNANRDDDVLAHWVIENECQNCLFVPQHLTPLLVVTNITRYGTHPPRLGIEPVNALERHSLFYWESAHQRRYEMVHRLTDDF